MNTLLAQLDITQLDPKKWLLAITGFLLSMILGRVIQAWNTGAGLKGCIMAIWFGTNAPKQKQDETKQ